MRVEDIKYKHYHCHHKEHCQADKVTDCIPPAHVLVNYLESLINLLGADSCHHLSQMKRHSEDKCNRDSNYPHSYDEGNS